MKLGSWRARPVATPLPLPVWWWSLNARPGHNGSRYLMGDQGAITRSLPLPVLFMGDD